MEQAIPTSVAVESENLAALDFRKLGMWLFLASEVIFFSALIVPFLHLRFGHPAEVTHEVLNIPLTALNTFILIVSSFTLVMGLGAVQHGSQRGLKLGLIATAVLGAIFLSLQAREWTSLFSEGFLPGQKVFATYFFTMTGFHGLHVTGGVIWCLIVIVRALRGGITRDKNLPVEVFGLYWHFVDLVWIILFTVLYLV